MMQVLVALLALQGSDLTEHKRNLDALMARSESIMEQSFDCMDREVKKQGMAQLSDATPSTVVDGALGACSHLKNQYLDALIAPGSPIARTEAQKIADGWFNDLRETYIKHVEQLMVKPEIAEARVKVVISQWRKCITDNATDWSRLQDEAATVGQAAVTACNDFRPKLTVAIGYQLQSKGLPAGQANVMADRLHGDMKDIATQVVISERAKRLPKASN